jgi:hypothetical protein
MLVAYLQKEKEVLQRPSILGVDVNVKCFAVTVLAPKGKCCIKHIWGKASMRNAAALCLGERSFSR